MSPAELIGELNSRGIELQANGEKLRAWPQELITSVDLDLLRRHKVVLLRLLRSEGADSTVRGRYPIIPGHVHFDFFQTPEDVVAGRWGEEFIPGYHVDPRQPSRLTGMLKPKERKR